MITQQKLKDHFLELGKKGALYVWGANGQTITKALMDSLYKSFGSTKYNKAYYDAKLKAGEGKPGADCSGALYPVSGYDTTASGYYKKCTKTGKISSIPREKVCLVFKVNSSGAINHVGCYTGDGYVSEMASSSKNYQRKKLDGNGWDYWGLPDFVDYSAGEALADPVPTPVPTTPAYSVGKTYTTQVELKVRTGPGTKYRAKKYSELTTDGKKHDADKDGALNKGTRVTCKEVRKVGQDIWIRTPSGWIASFYSGKVYVK